MGSVIHETRPVQVWVDADLGIAEMVEVLNSIPGVRTHASCQGTIGEGGPEQYGPYVEVSWDGPGARASIEARYSLEPQGEAWGYARPSKGQK
jgi:hypothetical protein